MHLSAAFNAGLISPLRSGLEPERALEVCERLLAAPELEQRQAEVVVREALVRVAGALAFEPRHGLLEERQRLLVLPLLHERVALVVQRVAVDDDFRGLRRRRRRWVARAAAPR